jgi:hypothetical protein
MVVAYDRISSSVLGFQSSLKGGLFFLKILFLAIETLHVLKIGAHKNLGA